MVIQSLPWAAHKNLFYIGFINLTKAFEFYSTKKQPCSLIIALCITKNPKTEKAQVLWTLTVRKAPRQGRGTRLRKGAASHSLAAGEVVRLFPEPASHRPDSSFWSFGSSQMLPGHDVTRDPFQPAQFSLHLAEKLWQPEQNVAQTLSHSH